MPRFVLLILAGASTIFAGQPIATVSSTGPIVIGGTELSANSVSSWALTSGDEIQTTGFGAILLFQDKSRVTLDRASRVKVAVNGGRTTVTVLSGSADYQFASGSQITVTGGGQSVGADSGLRGRIGATGRVESAVSPQGRFTANTRLLLRPSNSY